MILAEIFPAASRFQVPSLPRLSPWEVTAPAHAPPCRCCAMTLLTRAKDLPKFETAPGMTPRAPKGPTLRRPALRGGFDSVVRRRPPPLVSESRRLGGCDAENAAYSSHRPSGGGVGKVYKPMPLPLYRGSRLGTERT